MATNGSNHSSAGFQQEAVAVVGFACRLPGQCSTPDDFLNLLQEGRIASTNVPASRFNGKAFYAGANKAGSMRSPGGMFIENIDPKEFDANFFGIPKAAAVGMDPQQRQLLEVVYEALENAGNKLEELSAKVYGCFVGSYAVDYADMQSRDPLDRAPSVGVGVGRAMLSNRISYFLNIRGPSMTVDTACSGSLIGLDVACRYLSTGEIDGAIVAGANLYLSPEHASDGLGAMSLTGFCHTFDARADGYVKAEAINAVVVKRLADAVRDGDPIRAIIRGSASNNDGRTAAGITAPSSEAQATAIRVAYANAGIVDFNATSYVECHGTGTQAGDPAEVSGVASVFSPTRTADHPLIIGSAKANIGHAEPAAGLTGLIKTILTLEDDFIPGLPSFHTPNPNIDFEGHKLKVSRHAIPWPKVPFRRASVNSFGYGGSNVHVVVDAPNALQRSSFAFSKRCRTAGLSRIKSAPSKPPVLLVLSANDEQALQRSFQALKRHLLNPGVDLDLQALAYTLSQRRSRLFHQGFVTTSSTTLDLGRVITSKRRSKSPTIAFIFTGQGAQWPQQGKVLLELFPSAVSLVQELDRVLQELPHPPRWTLLDELTLPRSAEQMQKPELSQALVTALQLALVEILRAWNLLPAAVLGHSSGEIAAAAAAGLITNAQAITLAYYRGYAVENAVKSNDCGMLAVGVGANDAQAYLQGVEEAVEIACRNSSRSTTLSGKMEALGIVQSRLETAGVFARPLRVDVAYHSHFIKDVTEHYEQLITPVMRSARGSGGNVAMFSSLTGQRQEVDVDAHYWASNMASVVRFEDAFTTMIRDSDVGVNFLLEIGPSGALAGPVKQLIDSLELISEVSYAPAFARGKDAIPKLFESAGRAFAAGTDVDLLQVNRIDPTRRPPVIIDLPNYCWDRSQKYWYESESSKDWRDRLHPHHELLGSKILGTSWHEPSWKTALQLEHVPWIEDHKIGGDILFPATAYIAMAVEAVLQQHEALTGPAGEPKRSHGVRLRDVKFHQALPLSRERRTKMMLSLRPRSGVKEGWNEYKISSLVLDRWQEHSTGLVRLAHESEAAHRAVGAEAQPLDRPVPGSLWYKAMRDVGYGFGPSFQAQKAVEAIPGERRSRSSVTMRPASFEVPPSRYLIHPTILDGCLQSAAPAMWEGVRWNVRELLVPICMDDIFISSHVVSGADDAYVNVTSEFSGTGRTDLAKNHLYHLDVIDVHNGDRLVHVSGFTNGAMERPPSVYDHHRYSQVIWKPDISFSGGSTALLSGSFPPEHTDPLPLTQQYLDLVLHKYANISVLEIINIPHVSQSLWLELPVDYRAAAGHLVVGVSRLEELMKTQSQYPDEAVDDRIVLLDPSQQSHEEFASAHPGNATFDLVIYRSGPSNDQAEIINTTKAYLKKGGYLLLSNEHPPSSDGQTADDKPHSAPNGFTAPDTNCSPDSSRQHSLQCVTIDGQESSVSHDVTLWVDASDDGLQGSTRVLNVSSLTKPTEAISRLLQDIADAGWTVASGDDDLAAAGKSIIQVVIEDDEAILPDISEDRWNRLQKLLAGDSKVLWITKGSQLNVTHPMNALVHGLRRTAHAEDPSLQFVTLDAETIGSSAAPAVLAVLQRLQTGLQHQDDSPTDFEFAERGGVVYVSRVVPDVKVNAAALEHGRAQNGVPAKPTVLSSLEARVALYCERLGDLDSLTWQEEDIVQELEPGTVEVEIMAVSLAFKDVAVSMGLVPENEHLLGLDGAGYVRRVASTGVSSLRPGQRVIVSGKGQLANRVIKPACRVVELPDCLTFEQIATTPFITAIYSLEILSQLRKGSRVLIHSATGALGWAVIQLCKIAGAEVFATAGSEEKRQFLVTKHGLREDHVFSSRDTTFADGIRRVTGGRGVDIVLNSLTGELLEESWRCIAEGGTFVELGKRDLLDRGYLPMQPFLRNVSYRCVDLGHREISDETIGEILAKAVALLADRSLEPIEPVTVYGFDQGPAAFRAMGGYHIGCVIMSRSASPDVVVPIRPRLPVVRLEPDAAYVLVGGLKGLNGGIAVQLALWGAKTLVVLGRSNFDDDKSQAVLRELELLRTDVVLVQGDVSVPADARRCLEATPRPIRGIVQAAMVLRDRVFASMSHEEYHQALCSKVQGTWNLHVAAEDLGLPLDFFTLFSSISGLIGQRGQANYAAGNAFLDAFASYRKQLQLPCCSIDLGAIDDVGYMSEHGDLLKALDTTAWTPINQSLLHEILRFSIEQQGRDGAINQASSAQLVTSISHRQKPGEALLTDARFGILGRGYNSSGRSDWLQDVDGSKDGTATGEVRAFQTLLKSGGSLQALQQAAGAAVMAHLAHLLQSTQPLEAERSLNDYGIDSLAGVELRNWIRARLGADLSMLEINSMVSLGALGDEVAMRAARPAEVKG